MMNNVYSVAILMTCHDRAQLTKRCVESLLKSVENQALYRATFFVVNDGCTDNTGEILDKEFPTVNHLHGDGNLFWNGGMHLAFKEAVKHGYDFYLWVNDDVVFYDGMLEKLIKSYETVPEKECIFTGYTLGTDEKTVTYGGQRIKKGILPLNLSMIMPTEKLEKCDTMHGNCVLIHSSVVDLIGVNDPFYTHGFGDVDYGLTARKKGISIYLTNYPVGVCEKNPMSNRKNTYKNKNIIQRFKIMNSWRHRPIKDWLHFTRKFGGLLWFLRFIAPYAKLVVNKYE